MDLETAQWRKSSYSESTSECVEVAYLPGSVAIRDTKNRNAGTLVIPGPAWRALISDHTRPASL
ncbi:DUF397 domain-containing protein [Kibdelosporangium persicum]|uniref:DUF397 domain-containing protein n=1 Tax=Kibdelosporangium persicum TaxID=2698649 RepID=UPI001567B9E9|nr:DUF397 domain-containing protein [Kibdelosporangium persicum]